LRLVLLTGWALLPLLAAQPARQSCLGARPDQPEAWKLLGIVHASEQDYAAAESAFRQACERKPNLADACFYHGRVLYLLNRFEEALGTLQPLAANDPRIPRLLALSLDGLGRWAEAEAQYRKALRAAAGTGPEDARVDYGIALIRQGETSRALPYLTAAAAASATGNNPERVRASFHLGRALLQLGRLEDSRKHLETAVGLDPKHGAAHLLLGRVCQRLGLSEKAAHYLGIGEKLSR
jgi:tetratricopeptide (TPR) repeat protein